MIIPDFTAMSFFTWASFRLSKKKLQKPSPSLSSTVSVSDQRRSISHPIRFNSDSFSILQNTADDGNEVQNVVDDYGSAPLCIINDHEMIPKEYANEHHDVKMATAVDRAQRHKIYANSSAATIDGNGLSTDLDEFSADNDKFPSNYSLSVKSTEVQNVPKHRKLSRQILTPLQLNEITKTNNNVKFSFINDFYLFQFMTKLIVRTVRI